MSSLPTDPTQLRFQKSYEGVAEALILWVNLHVFPRLEKHVGADDIVQEVWCRAYRQFGTFDPGRGSFRAWVLGIAEKVLLEELRRLSRAPQSVPPGSRVRAVPPGSPGVSGSAGRSPTSPAQRTTTVPDMQGAPELMAELTSISERAARRETVTRLLQHAAKLSEADRQLLLCRGVEEQTYEEVGRRLGQDPEAVRSRWRRLREQLKWQL